MTHSHNPKLLYDALGSGSMAKKGFYWIGSERVSLRVAERWWLFVWECDTIPIKLIEL